MQIRGKGVDYRRVCGIVARVSATNYAGNVIVHPDARPLGKMTRETVRDGNDVVSRVDGYGFTGRFRCISSDGLGARRSWSGRRSPAVCWHAYRDCIRAILTVYPDATVTTMHARYVGLAGFEATYPGTADHNIGSEFAPAYMPDLCECGGWE